MRLDTISSVHGGFLLAIFEVQPAYARNPVLLTSVTQLHFLYLTPSLQVRPHPGYHPRFRTLRLVFRKVRCRLRFVSGAGYDSTMSTNFPRMGIEPKSLQSGAIEFSQCHSKMSREGQSRWPHPTSSQSQATSVLDIR